MNATLEKFGDPETRLWRGEHWTVLLRPAQLTLGSLVLGANGEQRAFGELSPSAFAELGTTIARIERVLSARFGYQRINYLMLMMVDPHVHFHVIPRYDGVRAFEGLDCEDRAWPGPPNLAESIELGAPRQAALLERLRLDFAEAG
ncbi:MAG: HIT family protein [Wenzhouxiangellaceae bacterium]|nr:HIT family protein [Wenzhouxiangellaceae bacterium]